MPLADSLNRRYLVAGGVALSLILLLSALHTTDTYPLYTTDDRYLYGIINHSEEYASEYHDAPFDGRAFRIPDHISARIKHYIPPVTPVRESYDSDVITGPEVRDSVGRFSIPRTIYQTWKTNVVGPKMMAAVSSWIEMNPEYEYILLNDTTADAYVNSFSNPKHVSPSTYVSSPASIERFAQKSFVPNGCSSEQIAPTDYMLTPEEIASVKDLYFACTVGASKADILRYMIMYEYGGVYFDVDSKCESPLREWIDADATYVTNIGLRADPAQWGLISAPGHPFMAQVLRKAITDVNSREEKCPRDAVEQVAGPPQLHGAVRQVLCNSELGGVVDRLQIYGQDQFAGRIRFKAEGVDPEREAQGYKHWYHANDD